MYRILTIFSLILSFLLLGACRQRGDTSLSADPSLKGNSKKYPYVDLSKPDAKLTFYSQKPEDYLRFTGATGKDSAKKGSKLIVNLAGLEGWDRTKPQSFFKPVNAPLSFRYYDYEKAYLNGTNLEPISLPRRALLKALKDFQKKYWRYAPNSNWSKLSAAEQKKQRNLYAHIDTFPRNHSQYNKNAIYPLANCIGISPSHWGPLQLHYFCMIPAAFRGCYRSTINGHQELKRRFGTDKHLFVDGKFPTRELALAACLTHRAKEDDPLFEKMAKAANFPAAVKVKTGKQYFKKFHFRKNQGKITKFFDDLVSPAVRDSFGDAGNLRTQEQRLDQLYNDIRTFYNDQFTTIGGKEINLFRYIMFAPTMQFKIEDQIAILNSLYYTMSVKDPKTGKDYWDKTSGYYQDEFCRVSCFGSNCNSNPSRPNPNATTTCSPKDYISQSNIRSRAR